MKKLIIFITLLFFTNSCGIYKYSDARKNPVNADERVKKNIEEGRGFRLGSITGKSGGDFLFYREGITPSVGRVIAELDAERMAVAQALGVPAASFLENFYQAGLTTKEAMISGDISRACVESEPNWKIKSPPSLDHRYIHEDVGYGLVPFAGFGRLAGVKTPTIDGIIHVISKMMDIPYATEGLTLDAMGLSGLDPKGVLKFVEEGF